MLFCRVEEPQKKSNQDNLIKNSKEETNNSLKEKTQIDTENVIVKTENGDKRNKTINNNNKANDLKDGDGDIKQSIPTSSRSYSVMQVRIIKTLVTIIVCY